MYSAELGMQMLVHRAYFFIGKHALWNMFDFFLVCITLQSYISPAEQGSTNLTFLRVLRILKMAKFLRIVRLMHFFKDLRVILHALLGSLVSLFWSVVAMALMFFLFGMIFVQGTSAYFLDVGRDLDADVETRLRASFGSVQTSMITLFKASSGGNDWSEFYEDLLPTGNAWIFLIFICFSHVALMNILTGLFVEKAMQLAEPDRDAMYLEKRQAEVIQMGEIRKLCHEIDISKDGIISYDEFKQEMHTHGSKLRHYLGTMGLSRDAELFFQVAKETQKDLNANGIEEDAFVRACMKLKGEAASLDIHAVLMQTARIQRQLDDMGEIVL
jgi:hypothetical protein